MLLHDIADYAVSERTGEIPEQALHWAKRAVIDWCATTAPGSIVQPATGLIQALGEDIGHGQARLFPSGRFATVRAAAIINAAASHTVEFDDIFRDAIYHPSTPVVSTALAVAEGENLSGDAFLRAVIVGYEISTRIALVLGRAHYRYWHNTATIGSFGAAAAAAGVRFVAVRAIVDPVGFAIPRIALDAVASNGTTRPWSVVTSLAHSPGDLPALLRLARWHRAALATLHQAAMLLRPAFATTGSRNERAKIA